jgi:hypothetical protein
LLLRQTVFAFSLAACAAKGFLVGGREAISTVLYQLQTCTLPHVSPSGKHAVFRKRDTQFETRIHIRGIIDLQNATPGVSILSLQRGLLFFHGNFCAVHKHIASCLAILKT